MRSCKKSIYPAAFAAILLILWAVIAGSQLVDSIILPSPRSVAGAFAPMFINEKFWLDVWSTTARVGAAVLVAAMLGIPFGLFLAHYRRVYEMVEAPLHALRSIPASALFPLFLIIVGVGEKSIIALAAYPSLLVILVNTVGGAALANKRRLHQAKTLGLSTPAILFEVLFYEALPHIFTGVRVAISYSLVLVVAVEMFIGVRNTGLGRKIYDYHAAYRIPQTYAAIIVSGILGIALNWIVTLLERRFLRWLPNAHDES